MLTLATLAVLASTLVAGAYLSSAQSGMSRPLRWQIVCVCWPFVAGLLVHELARFASNTNDQGGDITSQLLMEGLALLQLPLFGLGALGGVLIRASVDVPPLQPTDASAPARPIRPAAIALAGVAGACLLFGAVEVMRRMDTATSYPRTLPGDGSSLRGTDYGPDIEAAATAAPLPLLWLGPRAAGQSLGDVTLTTRSAEYPTFAPQSLVDYGEHGEIQISQALAGSGGQNDKFMTGRSVTVHGTTFWLGQPGMALGKIHDRDVMLQAPAAGPAQWRPILRRLRWVCAPPRTSCSGW